MRLSGRIRAASARKRRRPCSLHLPRRTLSWRIGGGQLFVGFVPLGCPGSEPKPRLSKALDPPIWWGQEGSGKLGDVRRGPGELRLSRGNRGNMRVRPLVLLLAAAGVTGIVERTEISKQWAEMYPGDAARQTALGRCYFENHNFNRF